MRRCGWGARGRTGWRRARAGRRRSPGSCSPEWRSCRCWRSGPTGRAAPPKTGPGRLDTPSRARCSRPPASVATHSRFSCSPWRARCCWAGRAYRSRARAHGCCSRSARWGSWTCSCTYGCRGTRPGARWGACWRGRRGRPSPFLVQPSCSVPWLEQPWWSRPTSGRCMRRGAPRRRPHRRAFPAGGEQGRAGARRSRGAGAVAGPARGGAGG